MKTVYHPTLNTSREVPNKDVEAWAEQGWRKTAPKSSAAATAAGNRASDPEKR